MADKTFVPGTVIDSPWLNDVNDNIYDGNVAPVGTLRHSLADTSDITKGDALIGVHRTEPNALGRTLHFWVQKSKLQMSNYCDPTVDTPTQVATAIANAISDAKAGQKVLEFDPGATYTTNAETSFLGTSGMKALKFWGNGATIFRSSGAGAVASLDSGGGSVRNSDIELCDFVFKGNAASTYGLYVRGMGIGGRVQKVRVIDVATAGYLIEWAVCCDFQDLYVSGAIDTFTVNPATGMIISRADPGNYTAACTFINTVLENPITSTGLDLVYSGLGNQFIGGTCESIPRGVRHRSTARETIIKGFDFEDNSDFDVFVEGQQLVLEDINSGSSTPAQFNIGLSATASGTQFRGGYVRQVDIDPGAVGTHFIGTAIDNNVSIGITNTGPYFSHGSYFVDTSVVGNKTFTSAVKDRQGVQNLGATFTCTQGVTPTRTLSKNEARQNGQMVAVQAQMAFTSAGTPAQPILVQIPANYAVKASAIGVPCGWFSFSNGSYSGAVVPTAATELSFVVSGSANLLGTTPAVTIAAGNILTFSAVYPGA